MNSFWKEIKIKIFSILNQNHLPLHLGRWSVKNCPIKINRIVDYSNIDHCGPCGLKSTSNQKSITIIKKQKNYLKKYKGN